MSEDLNMDQIWESGIDRDELVKAQADLLLDAATYTTVPALTLSFNEEPGKFDDRPVGSVAHYFGQIERLATDKDVESAAKAGTTIKEGDVLRRGSVGFNISPLRRNTQDKDGKDTGRPDRTFQLWMNAVAAYKVAYGQEPQAKSDVLNFVRDYAVRLRIGQYGVPTDKNPEPTGRDGKPMTPGNNVVAISAVK